MARPTLPIRPDQVATLARLGLNVVAIAEFFHCDRGTIYKRFGPEVAEARAEGRPCAGPGAGAVAAPACFGPGCVLHRDEPSPPRGV